jgi:LuxR family maltose regulon positive regulatory protein
MSVPFDLDEAKLAPPAIRPDTVVKTEVIGRLQSGTTPFTTVVAPAGYGKTTLLARWAEVDRRPFAWVSLDRRDDDSLVFLRGIAAAIHRVEPMPSSVLESLTGPGDTIWARVPHVGNALAAMDRPLVIALDDLHTVTNPSSHNVLEALFHYVPPQSQIAVTSREGPTLPLARWRVQGMVQEVGTADMRLDASEADALLRGAGVTLDAQAVAELTERTEGWPAGLYLAALSHRAGAPGAWRVEGFSGDDRFVSEYFRLEILSRLTGSEARFLLLTSVLGKMSAALCDAVLDIRDSAELLATLERSNHFLVPLDQRGEWYRYHHMFRQLLRTELQRSDPDAIQMLNRRAMDWYLAQDQPETAIRYGHAAGETEAVASVVDRLVMPVYYDGRMETMEEWLGWFSEDDLERFPALAVYDGWVKALTGRASAAQRLLAIAERSTSTIPLSDGSTSIEPWVNILRAAMMPNGADRARADAEVALEWMAPGSAWRPDALLQRGIAHFILGSSDLATDDLEAAFETAKTFGATDVQFLTQAELSLVAANRGAWIESARHAQIARTITERPGLGQYPVAALVHVASARVAVHERRPTEARAAMTRAHRLRANLDHGLPWLTVQVGLELARAHLGLGELDAAKGVLGEVDEVISLRPGLGILVDDARTLRDRAAALSGSGSGWAINLTAAELRLLPYLATHLTLPEIADRLFISTHTVRSEAQAIYRKLDASSRTEAVERAVDVGLLEPMFPHRTNVAVQ